MKLTIALAGDQRLAENVILEIRALAQHYGLGVSEVKVVSRSTVGQVTKKLRQDRRSSSRIRRGSSPR